MATEIWGDYSVDLEKVLGRGGMGTVYRAKQVSLGRTVALKVMRQDFMSNEEFVRRFHREAELIARLVDPHVVQIYGAGEHEGNHFYAMEFVEGTDLSSRIKSGKPFGPEEVLDVAEQVGAALKAAWKYRIVHRDIKPSNILITTEGTIKVMDFGLAKNPETELTQGNLIMGTAKYISPEQANGKECDVRSDIYSLGAVLYEIAAGRPPFSGDTAQAVVYGHLMRKPIPPRKLNPTLPPALEGLILRCLAKDPDKRFLGADDFLQAVRSIRQGVTPEEKTVLMNEFTDATPTGATVTSPTGTAEETLMELPGGMAEATMLDFGDPTLKKLRDEARRQEAGVLAADETDSTTAEGAAAIEGVVYDARSDVLVTLFSFLVLLGAVLFGHEVVWKPTHAPGPTVSGNGGNGGQAADTAIERARKDYQKAIDREEYREARRIAELFFGKDSQEYESADRELRLQNLIRAAEEHFSKSEWPGAILQYGEVLGMLSPDDPRRAKYERQREVARFREKEDAGEFPEALRLAEAIFGRESEEWTRVDRKHRESQFQVRLKRAEEVEATRNWAGAADEYQLALDVAPAEQKPIVEKTLAFCRDLALAQKAESEENWEQAIKIYERHVGAPRMHSEYLREVLERAEEKMETAKAATEERKKEEFQKKFKIAMDHFKAAEWAKALAAAQHAEEMGIQSEELNGLLRDLKEATSAPEGWVYVPAGAFSMGTDEGDEVEGPAHEAKTLAFYISARCVTRAEYAKFLASPEARSHEKCEPGERSNKDHRPDRWDPDQADDQPVTGVDWHDAMAYAAWSGARLPTEEEWEKAASHDLQTGRHRKYPWGDEFDPEAEDVSFYGCVGMGGGPLEWVDAELGPYPGTEARHADFGKGRRILRGGIVLQEDAAKNARTAFRYWHRATRRDRRFGFRCVRDIR